MIDILPGDISIYLYLSMPTIEIVICNSDYYDSFTDVVFVMQSYRLTPLNRNAITEIVKLERCED